LQIVVRKTMDFRGRFFSRVPVIRSYPGAL
jgi:hypothetical protein